MYSSLTERKRERERERERVRDRQTDRQREKHIKEIQNENETQKGQSRDKFSRKQLPIFFSISFFFVNTPFTRRHVASRFLSPISRFIRSLWWKKRIDLLVGSMETVPRSRQSNLSNGLWLEIVFVYNSPVVCVPDAKSLVDNDSLRETLSHVYSPRDWITVKPGTVPVSTDGFSSRLRENLL